MVQFRLKKNCVVEATGVGCVCPSPSVGMNVTIIKSGELHITTGCQEFLPICYQCLLQPPSIHHNTGQCEIITNVKMAKRWSYSATMEQVITLTMFNIHINPLSCVVIITKPRGICRC